jgi:hypothetical protein
MCKHEYGIEETQTDYLPPNLVRFFILLPDRAQHWFRRRRLAAAAAGLKKSLEIFGISPDDHKLRHHLFSPSFPPVLPHSLFRLRRMRLKQVSRRLPQKIHRRRFIAAAAAFRERERAHDIHGKTWGGGLERVSDGEAISVA